MSIRIYTDDSSVGRKYSDVTYIVDADTIEDLFYYALPDMAMLYFSTAEQTRFLMERLESNNVECYPIPTDYDYDEAMVWIDEFVKENSRPKWLKIMEEIADVDTSKIFHMRTGIGALDKEINGLYAGQVSVLFSYAGEGKSTLASSIMNNIIANTDYKCLAYSGELEDYVFKDWLVHQVASSMWVNNDELDKYKPALAKVYGEQLYLIADDNQYEAYMKDSDAKRIGQKVIDNLKDALDYDNKIKLVVVDNLMTAMDELDAKDDVYVAQAQFMQDLIGFAVARQVHVMLVCHCKKENARSEEMSQYDISGSSAIPNKASLIISIRRDKDTNMSYLSVHKDRYSGARLVREGKDKDMRIRLQYIPETRNYLWSPNPDADVNVRDDWFSMPVDKLRNKAIELANKRG